MDNSYDLENSILYRIPHSDQSRETQFDSWLMTNIFRHVENPSAEEINLDQKYIGKVKFTKITGKSKYEGEYYEKWIPPRKNENGDDIEDRKPIIDIQMVVYSDDAMTVVRRYELEHGWKDEWIQDGIFHLEQEPEKIPQTEKMYKEYKEFEAFKKKWPDLMRQIKVPGWYLFDPARPIDHPDNHNMMKKWDEAMFNFLKDQKWMEQKQEKDALGRNQYEEKSDFVVDCSQLLGIGGEGIVIRKPKIVNSNIGGETTALKIIPLKECDLNSEESILDKMIRPRQKQTTETNMHVENDVDAIIQYQDIYLDSITNFSYKIPVLIIGTITRNNVF